jgi:hypothetical protein
MRFFLIGTAALLAATAAGWAQDSPPATESRAIGGKTITIKYNSPRVRGRVGKLFGKDGTIGHDANYPIWRAGANPATSFHTDADLTVGGLAVPKGDYTLYVNLADPEHWELVINKQTGQWGLDYDRSRDLGRVKMTMSRPPKPIENLKYTIADEGGNKGKLTLEWENHIASVPITMK